MADLNDTPLVDNQDNPIWEAGVYQIETTDPVVAGPPDVATKAGVANVPSLQLARRTQYLKALLEAIPGQTVSPADLTTAIADFVTSSMLADAIAALLGGAPAALDTLKELGDALGDNDSEIAALTSAIGSKLNSSSFTAAAILSMLKTVDGSGSGLDADLLDGSSLGTINAAIAAKLSSSQYTAADILAKLKSVDTNNSGLNASTVKGIDGSNITHAGLALGDVGSFAFLARLDGETVVPGASYSGSQLRFAGVASQNDWNHNTSNTIAGTVSVGTWRAFGGNGPPAATGYVIATIFLRIA